ncbi:hypothetical protein GW17_00032124 [Ensete ventricosum]|nr:hypothetical protein GW17_00032124 [Ensete ventricosum]
MEATTNNSTEPLLPSSASYTLNLSRIDNELRSFRSYLKWMCIDKSNAKHAIVSWSLFLLLGVFVPIASNFILSYTLNRHTYDVMVQLSLTSASDLSYLCLSAFVTNTWTARYRAVPPKIDRRRSISAVGRRQSISPVGGRLKKKSTVDDRLREKLIVAKLIVDGRLRKKKGRRGKEEKKKRRIPRPRAVTAHGSPALAAAFSPARGDGASPRAGRKIEATSPRRRSVPVPTIYRYISTDR